MPLFPRVTTSRSCLHPHPMAVLTRASVHPTTAISQEGKRQTPVASGGHILWAHNGMWRIVSLSHQISLPLSWVEVSPLATQGFCQPVSVAKLRQGPWAVGRSLSRELTEPNQYRRRAASLRSSPTTSTASGFFPSPPATRLRSRKVSGDDGSVAPTLRPTRSRGKAKHVEFNEQVQVANVEALSDLTDLSDAEPNSPPKYPSPRRLRSQGGRTARTPPKRESKKKISNSSQDGDEVDDEVDELTSSRSVTPPPVITDRTPVKRRLRPRQTQTHTPPDESDDGDDEEEEEGVGAAEDAVSVDVAEEDDATLVEPRKLRNGKIVGEDEGLEIVDEQEGSEESAQEEIPVDDEIDLEAEDDESEESSHDEFAEETMDDGE